MPYYTYEGRDGSGKRVKSQSFATSEAELIRGLQASGIVILSVKSAEALTEARRRRHKRVKGKDLVLFAKEMAVLMENGITMIEALEVIMKQSSSEKLAEAIALIKKDLENGSSLHGAIAKMPHIFGDLWTYLIEAGESSGQMPFVLRHIQYFLESREEIRKKTVNAMIYPIILLITTAGAVTVMAFKVIPMFRSIYASMGVSGDLPLITKGVLAFSELVTKEFTLFASGTILFVFLARQFVTTSLGRRAYERSILASPLLGQLSSALVVEKFSTTFQVLLKSGISIVRALEMAANTAGNHFFAERIDEVRAKVIAGMPLAEALHHTGLFSPIAISFVTVAEKTGNYSGMFEEIAKYHKDIIETTLTRVMSLMEPIMLIMMAFVVGIVVIAMFLPIFKLANL